MSVQSRFLGRGEQSRRRGPQDPSSFYECGIVVVPGVIEFIRVNFMANTGHKWIYALTIEWSYLGVFLIMSETANVPNHVK